jgi:hypothetical protein
MDPLYDSVQLITISPPPQVESPKTTYFKWYIPLIIALKPATTMFVLYPELDETGRLHFHGIVYVKDWAKLFRHAYPWIRKNVGFIDIRKKANNKLGWLMYCMKNWARTQQDLEIDEPIYRKRIGPKTTVPKPEPLPRVNNIFDYFMIKD